MTDEATETNVARARLLRAGGRFAFPIPDALMAALCALAAVIETFPKGELAFALLVEGGFLLMQGTLVDIATRLRKRPPLWVVVLIVVGVALFSGHTLDVLRMAWERGALVFVPLLLSLAQRATILWRMPDRPPIEKMAARALIANRITTGLAMLALVTALMLLSDFAAWHPLLAGAIYFAVAAYDDARVRGPKFAESPRVLFRWDPIGVKYLDPI